jgi:hypothetical protein
MCKASSKHSNAPAPLITKSSTPYGYSVSQLGVKFSVRAAMFITPCVRHTPPTGYVYTAPATDQVFRTGHLNFIRNSFDLL